MARGVDGGAALSTRGYVRRITVQVEMMDGTLEVMEIKEPPSVTIEQESSCAEDEFVSLTGLARGSDYSMILKIGVGLSPVRVWRLHDRPLSHAERVAEIHRQQENDARAFEEWARLGELPGEPRM